MTTLTTERSIAQWARDQYPQFPWQRFDELRRMANYELLYGPLGADYWRDAEELDTPWPGFVSACAMLRDLLDDLPTLYYFEEWGGIDDQDNDDEPSTMFTPAEVFISSTLRPYITR